MIPEFPRVLIAGIGNIFLGDDAFGVEVAQQMIRCRSADCLPQQVRIVDFGIRGLDLAYALCDSVEIAILVDAAPLGQPAGTLQVLEIQYPPASGAPVALDGHSLDPVKVLSVAASMDARLRRVLLVACEPDLSDDQEMRMGLSKAVADAVPHAVDLLNDLVREITSAHEEEPQLQRSMA
jgi:hydrogenase maturation protease